MKKTCTLAFTLLMALSLVLMFSGCAGSKAKMSEGMTGTWNLMVDTPSGSGTPVFEIKDEGGKLSGKYKGAFGEAPLKGEVKGKDFAIEFTSSGLPMTYTGIVDGNKMKGKIDFGGQGEGTFEGQR